VVNKESRTVPYKFNYSQQRIRQFVEESDREQVPFRGIILKSRQVGSTTLCSALATAKTISLDNYRAVVLAHLDRRAREILNKCRFFYGHLPGVLQLPTRKNNQTGMAFEGANSEIVVSTAENAYQVRGDTIHFLVGSEAAHWSDYRGAMLEMGPIVPFKPGTYVFQETTGRFKGEAFHDAYLEAKQNTLNPSKFSKYSYKAIFLPWHEDPDATVPFNTDEEAYNFLKMLEYQEPELFEKCRYFKLTAEQAHYAFMQLMTAAQGDYPYFCREFPFDDAEAFQAQGSSYFGQDTLMRLQPDPAYVSYIWQEQPFRQVIDSYNSLTRIDNPKSSYYHLPILKVWKNARTGGRYLVTADISEGEAFSDYTSIRCIDMITRETMATFHGKIRPDETAFVMASLAKIYNNALAAPEANGIGHYTLAVLRSIYHNIYVWKKWDKQDFSSATGRTGAASLGWYTTVASRPLMLSELYKVVKDVARNQLHDYGLFKDKADIEEMQTFTALDGAKPEAANNCKDDRVMSLAMAHIISHQECAGGTYDIYSKYREDSQIENLLVEMYDDVGIDPTRIVDVITAGRLFTDPENRRRTEEYESEYERRL